LRAPFTSRLGGGDDSGAVARQHSELQNVIERSVILCDGTFSVDESWLSHQKALDPASVKHKAQDKEVIEAALAHTKGRVSGPSGAAIRLVLPASTLDSKIKSLKIDKRGFQATNDGNPPERHSQNTMPLPLKKWHNLW